MLKKTLIIFLLAVTILFSFTLNSYASDNVHTFTFSFKDKKIDLPDISYSNNSLNFDDFKYYLCFYDYSKNIHWFYISTSPVYITDNVTQFYTSICSKFNIDDGKALNFIIDKGKDYWQYNNTLDCPYSFANDLFRTYYKGQRTDIFIYTNYDLTYKDEILYYAYGTTPLLKTMRSIKTMDNVTSEIVSILPVILVILVGFIGIRKGIDFIKTHIKNV